MTGQKRENRRKGSVLPLTVLCLVGMCGFVGLAIDIGLIATVRTQCQSAADAAAMSGARSLNGATGQNLGTATTSGTAMYNAVQTAIANPVMGGKVLTANVTSRFGTWHYDTTTQLFSPTFPNAQGALPTGDNYNLCEITVTHNVKVTFAAVFQAIDPSFNSISTVTAVAQAAHRPRDVAIILDYSGSMNDESDLWNSVDFLDNGSNNTHRSYQWPQSSNPNNTSNNLETVYPQFGHYANNNNYSDYTCYPNLLCPSSASAPTNYFKPASGSAPASASLIGKCNVSTGAAGVVAMVGDYYSNARGATLLTSAFTSQSDSYATTPGGDKYLRNQGGTSKSWTSPAGTSFSTTRATRVSDVLNSTSTNTNWETYGYPSVSGSRYKDENGTDVTTFNGYTVGPRYRGKTFFVWPPDPTNDWRSKFYKNSAGTAGLTDNTKLFQDSYPGHLDPSGNYQINYAAILNWIKNTGTNPFPTQLRSGNVLFYSAIPSDVPSSAYTHTNLNSDITNADQRFWKEYIDYTLGVWRSPYGNVVHTQSEACSMGPDFTFGTVKISAKPDASTGKYMDYDDNPWRPRHRMWFGPMTMIQFMSDTGILPGTAHDIATYPMKSGVGAALTDIQNNHPNDRVAMLPYARPQCNDDPAGAGTYNKPQYNMNNNYTAMLNSLWLPNVSGSDVSPWDTSTVQIPRARDDFNYNTSAHYGFMLAYNQFSSASTLQTNSVGGLRAQGATRLVIYETDGMANINVTPTGGSSGFVTGSPAAYNSYYALLPGQTINSTTYNQTDLLRVVEAICNKDDGTPYRTLPTSSPYPSPQPTTPGFATASKPVIVHCIAFGAIFETANSTQTSSVALMQQISTIGGTVFPSAATPTSTELAADPTTAYKWCTGTLEQRRNKLQNAILQIFDSSVPVSLIQ